MKLGGPGGQHVNKTNSVVRLKHRPTGIQIRVDSDRSQHRSRKQAWPLFIGAPLVSGSGSRHHCDHLL